jgi:signal transduction histidine kinase
MATIRVLLAEDDETEAAQTMSMLSETEEATVEVEWVATAEDALARMTRCTYDACLLDVTLGAASGIDVLRQGLERGCSAPIILLAQPGDADRDSEALRLGAADYLVKGEMTAPQLQRSVRHAIQRARVAHALRESQGRLLQAERMESLGRLAGGIAHDFNNLLSGILTYTSALERQIEPEHPSREPIDAIRRTTELASRLARQLLAYGRKQTLQQAEVDLNAVVDGLADILRRLIGEHLQFEVLTTPGLPLVTSDRAQLEQVVMNLVLNARDATPPGGRITVRTGTVTLSPAEAERERVQKAGVYVFVAVEDTGRGMSADVLARIFEPFFTTKVKGSGTGLGLASAYGIVTQSGGFLRPESEVGVGTRMTAFLPQAEATAASAAAPTSEGRVAGPGTELVLVVEDEQAVRRYIGDALTRFGYQSVLVETPGEALALFSHGPAPFDLLLTDIVLPEMSGMHLAQRLTKLHPALRVVFMSGYIDPRTGHAALPAGAHFLRKPFPPDELARVIRRAMEA